jgi:hypothetical protein
MTSRGLFICKIVLNSLFICKIVPNSLFICKIILNSLFIRKIILNGLFICKIILNSLLSQVFSKKKLKAEMRTLHATVGTVSMSDAGRQAET